MFKKSKATVKSKSSSRSPAAVEPASKRTRSRTDRSSSGSTKSSSRGRSNSDTGDKTPTKKTGLVKGAFGRMVDPNAPKKTGSRSRSKPVKFVFKAPKEYKSGFIEVGFALDKDGFIAPGVTVDAVKGKPDNPDNPRYDLVVHDPDTAMCLVNRLCMLTYVTNVKKRLGANQEFLLLIRVSVSRTKHGEIRASVKAAWRVDGKGKLKEITNKKDVEYSRLRRAGKFLAAAFQDSIDIVTLKQMEKDYQARLDAEDAAAEEEDDE